jgi:hypothetical protein
MESEVPPTDALLPGEPAPAPIPSEHDQHLREMEQSFEVLEKTVAHRLVRLVKIAVPAFIGVILAAVGSYLLGGYLRDRAERKRIARQMKIVRAERIVRAGRILGRRTGFRARRRANPALVESPLSVSEAGEIITGVLAELDA